MTYRGPWLDPPSFYGLITSRMRPVQKWFAYNSIATTDFAAACEDPAGTSDVDFDNTNEFDWIRHRDLTTGDITYFLGQAHYFFDVGTPLRAGLTAYVPPPETWPPGAIDFEYEWVFPDWPDSFAQLKPEVGIGITQWIDSAPFGGATFNTQDLTIQMRRRPPSTMVYEANGRPADAGMIWIKGADLPALTLITEQLIPDNHNGATLEGIQPLTDINVVAGAGSPLTTLAFTLNVKAQIDHTPFTVADAEYAGRELFIDVDVAGGFAFDFSVAFTSPRYRFIFDGPDLVSVAAARPVASFQPAIPVRAGSDI